MSGLATMPAAAPAETGASVDTSLVDTVSRAMALLDAGDVLAARVLAGKAYDDARSASRLAARFEGAERLVGKARRLQGEALLIETRAKIAIADGWDAAKEAGLIDKGGRPRADGKPVDGEDRFSAREAGLDRREIHDARKLRDAEAKQPGLLERAIAARLAQGLEPTRALIRGLGTRSAPMDERGDDFYETPREAVAALLALEPLPALIWEPACGRGAISRLLEDAGHDVALSDLVDRGCADRHGEVARVADFLTTEAGFPGEAAGGDCAIVTNPPFRHANAFAAHALRVHRPAKLALLLNLNFLAGFEDADRCYALDACRPARVHVFTRRLPMMHRDGWDGPRSGSQMNTAWFVWERDAAGGYDGGFAINRVDWRAHAGADGAGGKESE